MTGSFDFTISTHKTCFNLSIKRNITLIVGNSGTGKTTLCKLIDLYNANEASVKVNFTKNKCFLRVLKEQAWEYVIESSKNTIFFIDEGAKFVSSKEFARILQHTDNYFVIINRHISSLNCLPICSSEVYEFYKETIGKQDRITNICFFNRNKLSIADKYTTYKTLITEDGKSGFYFFKNVLNSSDKKCISADGKDKIVNMLSTTDRPCLVVADNAAFGVTLYTILGILNCDLKKNVHFWLPESFEYFLLQNIVFIKQLKLSNTTNKPAFKELSILIKTNCPCVDSSKFISWERYFTDLFERCCVELGYSYDKSKVPSFIMDNTEVLQHLINDLPFII